MKAEQMVDTKNTLIVVTADHSHTFTIVGYPHRNKSIFGVEMGDNDEWGPKDFNPYTILSYANGPSAKVNKSREDLSNVDTEALDFMQPSLVPMKDESHGGEDVPIFARGPFAFVFQSTRDNTFIAHSINAALCIGPYQHLRHCNFANMPSAQLGLIYLMEFITLIYLTKFF
ncbi:unnamed protein product [Protopolystoma xenopodis]|uniref:alkaline phosphatase n=1 Tax=Protopolystoma xenopodis TaxID=117903 RepID=A0A3S5AGD5_9PLAT|nr:unnamed protein product [Protopolystoma xenopodis]